MIKSFLLVPNRKVDFLVARCELMVLKDVSGFVRLTVEFDMVGLCLDYC